MSPRPPFLEELKRRKVVRAALVYVAGAFAAIQAADVLFPVLRLPDWSMGLVVGLAAIGLPIAVGLAWAFDLTSDGVARERAGGEHPAAASPAWFSAKTALLVALMLATGVAAGWLARSASAGPSVAAGSSIAVIPFDNLSTEAENAYFAIGIQDEILTQLQKISDLHVISRSSAMRYPPGPDRAPIPEIGRELNAAWIVEGSVARVGQSLKINVQLIESASASHAWAEVYEGDLSVQGMLAFQGQIAQRVAESLRATIQPDEQARIAAVPTNDTEAYDLYLRGNELFARRREADLRRALELFGRAIAIDSTYALAWAGRALIYAVLPFYGDVNPRQTFAEGLAAAYHALALDSTVAEAHAALGDLRLHGDYDATGAEAALRRAIELKPSYAQAHDWLSETLRARRRIAEALAAERRALSLDPLSVRINTSLGGLLLDDGQTGAAIAQLEAAGRLDPGFAAAQQALADALMLAGRYHEAAVAYRRYVAIVGPDAHALVSVAEAMASGDDAARTAALRELDAIDASSWRLSATHIAQAHLWLGQKTAALDWLDRAWESREVTLPFVNSIRAFEPLRDDPRFQSLLAKLGLAAS